MHAVSYPILIVDNVENSAQTLRKYLQMHEPNWLIDIAVRSDATVERVVDRVKDRIAGGDSFAVVITDLQMGTDDMGIRVIEAVQKNDPLVMTILYTTRSGLLKKQDTTGLGAFDVVVKDKNDSWPDTADRIVERTRAAIRYRQWAERITFLRRYFDPQLFKTIEDDPSVLQPKSRDVTVVFWDIRGFSALCEDLKTDPELISGFLKEYCDVAAKTIFENAGFLDKFMGDGVMALFGVLDQSEQGQKDAALAAVRAASMLSIQFESLVQQWRNKWLLRVRKELIELRLGCGIHTGRALIGNLGTEFRDQFTAVGPEVNFAQRLESLAAREEGQEILISQPTAARIEDSVRVKVVRVEKNVKNIPGDHPVSSVDRDEVLRHFPPQASNSGSSTRSRGAASGSSSG